jgi:tight adherence protein B
MGGFDTQTIALFFLATVAVGGVAWVFVYPYLSGEAKAEKRREFVAKPEPARAAAKAAAAPRARRESVEETLKELEVRQQAAKRPPLSVRITQAGLSWSKRQFIIVSAMSGFALFVGAFVVGAGLLPAVALAFAGGVGLPMWLLAFLKKRREDKFLYHLPDAVDVIIRGVKSGLPLGDCLKIVAAEAEEPVRSEFRVIVETQTVGIPMGEACARLFERVPLPEANFFGIVISIQQRAGGNLSEALSNLSKVLRDRKRMKAKIKAMSMEAKASAIIIGMLPIGVMLLVYITSPRYIELLWTHPMGRMMLAGSAAWMTMGVLVMRKMINFDF